MITPADATKFLSNVPKEKVFKTYSGPDIANLYELSETIEKISDESFNHHVGVERNDFANWIRDVIKDEELANSIAGITKKSTMAKIVKKRIELLERIKAEDHTLVKERFVSGVIDFVIGIIIGFIIGILVAFFFR